MALTRPSDDLANKTNVNPSVIRRQEATAEDFEEISALLDEQADAIENLQQSNSNNPYYGTYSSFSILQAAQTNVLENGWAIIDAGTGITPQIAFWDNANSIWELSGAQDNHVFVNTENDLSISGLPNIDYIALDSMVVYVWYNNEYLVKSPNKSDISKLFFTATAEQTSFNIQSRPQELNAVYFGRQRAIITEDYTYTSSNGILSFEFPHIEGTIITIEYF